MRDNPLQFAVVREDPLLEAEVVRRLGCGRVLLVASGGCMALSLQVLFPDLDLTLVDPNPAQLAHVRAKLDALERLGVAQRGPAFNVGTDDPQGLSERGNFESLFRGLRQLLHDLVLPREDMLAMFQDASTLEEGRLVLKESPYWPAAFRMFFCDPFLEAMFGPDATQHATPGSYPAYFQALFESGLAAPGAADNPFLHHVLLGHYLDRPNCLPPFLASPAPRWRLHLVEGLIRDLSDLGSYDLVSLSNIFDWMAPADVSKLVGHLCRDVRPGAAVVYRQLNNQRDLEAVFGEQFRFDGSLGKQLHAADRSLFYSSVHVGIRR